MLSTHFLTGSSSGPPRVIVLIPLTDAASTEKYLQAIITQASSHHRKDKSAATMVSFAQLKAKCMFLQCSSRNSMDILDLCQIADIILFVSKEGLEAGEVIDDVSL